MKRTFKIIGRTALAACIAAGLLLPAKAATDISQQSLMEQESRYEKEKSEYLQHEVLDKILGAGKAVVDVDVQFGVETRTSSQEAKERKNEKKKRLGDVDYLLPGVPNPKSVSQENTPGESKEESGQAGESKVEVITVIKKLIVTILHDEKIPQVKLNAVKEAVTVFLRVDFKRGDKIEFKKTPFTQDYETLLKPQTLIFLIFGMLLLFFLFGPLAGFLRSYVRTLREKGGTEVTVDSKFEGADGEGEGGGGGGGAGGLTSAELEALEKEGKKYHPFEYINDENLKRMVYLIRREPPQTVALVVSYLKPEYVREVLNSLTPEMQAKVALEMATIRSMTQEQVQQVDNYIKEKIEFLIGGIYHLLQTLDQVDRVTQNNILEYLMNEKPDLYEKVRKHIIMFEDIPSFPDQAMQVIIRELKTPNLAKALRNAAAEVMNKFLSNMSANAAAILKEEMEYGRPITDDEIEEERKNIINSIKQLEKDGRVFIREKPKAEVLEGVEDENASSSGAPAAAGTASAEPAADYDQYYAAAVDLYTNGRYDEAVPYFEYCAQLNAADAGIHQYLGNTYFTLGRTAEAVACFEKALALNPNDADLRTWLTEQKKTLAGGM